MGMVYLPLDCVADNGFLYRYYADAGFMDRGVIEAWYADPFGKMRLLRFDRCVGADSDSGL